jgi:hypothetical protein
MVVCLAVYPREKSNLDWWACGLISLVVPVAIFGWLVAVKSRKYMDWSAPYSLTTPFFPMNKYPLRYWFVAAQSMIAGGAVSFLIDLVSQSGNEAFGGTFFCLGLTTVITLNIWIVRFKPM